MSYSEAYGPELIIQHTGQVFPLAQETVTIGADAGNAIILADPEVSAQHAVISWQAETNTYVIEDLASAAGTYINERPVEKPTPLRHGDVLRVGNTIVDVRLEPVAEDVPVLPLEEGPPDDQWTDTVSRSPLLIGIVIVLLAGITVACCILAGTILLSGGKGTPEVVIQSPADGAQITVNSEIILQATASGAKDITILELSVDGALVATATSSDPKGESSLTVSTPWTFTVPGDHEVSAVAHTESGRTSRPDSVKVTAVSAEGEPRPTATPTPEPGQPTNTPTPPPEPTATPKPGETLPPPPQIEYFQASPASITTGGCTTLQWGTVSNATEASIEPDVGGVGTPGSATVCPADTTTYILTAKGPGGTTTASTVVTVVGALADLILDAITFDPNPAVQNQDNEVKITIRNAGAGAAGTFNWEWRAGSDARFDGRLRGLDAGETTVVTVRWKPSVAYARLDTVARVDIDDEVPESDEGNNELWTSVQVLEEEEEGGARTETFLSEAPLDGYRSNDGRGSAKADIFVGNSELSETVGEVVWRGFMSFDVSSIPNGAVVESVGLRFYQAKVGGDPYTKLGRLILDHVDYGSSLDDSAFDTPALDSAILAPQPSLDAWYAFGSPLFDDWLEKDLAAGRTRFQLRLRWEQETDGDGREDYAGIESADDFFGTGNAPELTVTYTQ
jgi:pSer/pThr/pTyr-binding forkhead associated (FHA) protein